jgi:hypothetical protein
MGRDTSEEAVAVLRIVRPNRGDELLVNLGPQREAIVSWNAAEVSGAIDVRVNSADGRTSAWLPYVEFTGEERRSLSGRDTFVRIVTDVIRSDVDFVSVGVRSRGELAALAVSTPDYGAPSPIVALPAVDLDVPALSQYDAAAPLERGWCAPATLAMLLAYRGYPLDVATVAREVYDSAYRGTGNWAFNAAFAGTLGFRAAVLHLRDLEHAHAFLADDVPLALSLAWRAGELPGAALPASDGHLVVLRGIDAAGDALVNDPALPSRTATIARDAFERAWLAHGGVAFAVVPAPRAPALVRLANQ